MLTAWAWDCGGAVRATTGRLIAWLGGAFTAVCVPELLPRRDSRPGCWLGPADMRAWPTAAAERCTADPCTLPALVNTLCGTATTCAWFM